MILQSMTAFVLQQDRQRNELQLQHNKNLGNKEDLQTIVNYAKFLSKPLTLGMFVPCDEDGNVLEEPQIKGFLGSEIIEYEAHKIQCLKYKESKEKVLFSGFTVEKRKNYYVVYDGINEVWVSWNVSKIVEDILWTCAKLTPTAIKQLQNDYQF